jgi:hypothetical protein
MILLINAGRIKRHWLATILLATILFLTGAAWYSTTKFETMPVKASIPLSENPAISKSPIAGVEKNENQTPIVTNSSFAPFLDVVPSSDGTALFINAGTDEVGGTVFANVSIGGGHDKGWTMVYSDSVDAYLTTATGFTPGTGQDGSMSITTTLGLDTGITDFNRVYVPAPSTIIVPHDIFVEDLKLSLVSTGTLSSAAYIAAVRSYAPPGPAPLGHQFVGSAYSIRASGALLTSNKSMSLSISFNETSLAGVDPHTLAIFTWDAFHKQWDHELAGTLFYDPLHPNDPSRNFISTKILTFTTYALIATPVWYDDFDEYTGLDFTQFDNIDWAPGSLALAGTATNGSAVSQPITPTVPITSWGSLVFIPTVDPPTTTLTVDILSLDGSEVLTDVASGTDLAGLIDPALYPSLRLRVNMNSTVAGETPTLEMWQLSWQPDDNPSPEQKRIYLPVVFR